MTHSALPAKFPKHYKEADIRTKDTRMQLMSYIKVKWIHSCPDYPVLLYSELDGERWEMRKVEVFADGHFGYASSTESGGSTRLGHDPHTHLGRNRIGPPVEPVEIAKEEFEEVWARRKS